MTAPKLRKTEPGRKPGFRVSVLPASTETDYQAVFHGANDTIFIHDVETGAILDANLKSSELFGYGPEELKKMDVGLLSGGRPFTQTEAMRRIRLAARGAPQVFEWLIRHSSGRTLWAEVSLKRIAIGGRTRVLAIVRDVAERKLFEERILSLNRLKETLLGPSTLTDKLELITRGIVDIFDLECSGIWLRRPGDRCGSGCIHSQAERGPHGCRSQDPCLHLAARADRTADPGETPHDRVPLGSGAIGRAAAGLEGRVLSSEVGCDSDSPESPWAKRLGLASFAGFPVLSTDGRPTGVLGAYGKAPILPRDAAMLEDLARTTSQVIQAATAEAGRKAIEEKYRLVVDNATEGIFVAQDGVVKFANPISSNMVGTSSDELPKRPFVDMIHPDDRDMVVERHLRRLQGERFPGTYPFRVIAGTGEVFWVEINAVLINWEGRPATLNFVRDVTAQKKLEEQLRHAQKMEALGRLAGGVAHDFNNLLTAILGFSDLLLSSMGPDDAARKNVEEIQKAGKRAASLTAQLLAFGRKQVRRPRVMDLNETISGIEGMLRQLLSREIELATLLDPHAAPILADPGQIEQVLVNLVVNARDAMPAGGKLVVETANFILEEHLEIDGLPPPGRYVCLTVSDTGVGISQASLPRIFDPFYTTKELGKGAGLGLATVYGIVTQSGGNISVSSAPGKGTVFRLHFPQACGAPPCPDAPPLPEAPAERDETPEGN
ncbi:MAG: PAS domain S-box protein [bacterium]